MGCCGGLRLEAERDERGGSTGSVRIISYGSTIYNAAEGSAAIEDNGDFQQERISDTSVLERAFDRA